MNKEPPYKQIFVNFTSILRKPVKILFSFPSNLFYEGFTVYVSSKLFSRSYRITFIVAWIYFDIKYSSRSSQSEECFQIFLVNLPKKWYTPQLFWGKNLISLYFYAFPLQICCELIILLILKDVLQSYLSHS